MNVDLLVRGANLPDGREGVEFWSFGHFMY